MADEAPGEIRASPEPCLERAGFPVHVRSEVSRCEHVLAPGPPKGSHLLALPERFHWARRPCKRSGPAAIIIIIVRGPANERGEVNAPLE